ncbi:MAG: methyltransferase domain-containing protein [Nitrosomonadales bacterium]|jgi:SAM-dependent methyltransferase|nr:methyltransferase domain-containing protein [Nitrosomonadales bacterium]MBT4759500.1 methyltransferase domain-containing protein [Nitrosomonadales bacterium]MBT5572729.1 methyltransferase domain-containing protein [Nitrosomonadales bacterium]
MNWFDTELGKSLVDFEQKVMQKYLQQKFGYYALQLGEHKKNLIKATKIKHHIIARGKEKNVDLDEEWLPFDFDSIDLILCLHLFERVGNPQKLMDELFRVTVSGGYIILCGFNPISFAGLRKLIKFDNFYPWNGSFLSISRIQNLLKQSGFTLRESKFEHYQPLFFDGKSNINNNLEKIGNRWLPLFGNIYFIVAEKVTVSKAPKKKEWNKIKKREVAVTKSYD